MYAEDDMLMLSGIQHFKFCPRQWALIHLEQQWEDNRLTTEGSLMHRNVDDPFYRQKCGDNICLRSVHIASKELGLYGIADVIFILHPMKLTAYNIPNILDYGRRILSNINTANLKETKQMRYS